MAKALISLASVAAGAAAAAAVLRGRAAHNGAASLVDPVVTPTPGSSPGSRYAKGRCGDDPGVGYPSLGADVGSSDGDSDVIAAIDAARARLRSQVPARPGERRAVPAA